MRSSLLCMVFLVWGCSSSDFAVANEGVVDGSVEDSTGVTEDSGGTSTDSGGTTSDSGGTTTDSGGGTEVGGGDGSILDVGGGDAGPTCPRPASTKTYDFSAYGCDKLSAAYAETLAGAKVCGCDGDCSTTLPDNFCNNCKSFVSPGNDAYRAAQAILAEFQKRVMTGACPPLACPDVICPDPIAAGCHGSGPGTVTTCRKAG